MFAALLADNAGLISRASVTAARAITGVTLHNISNVVTVTKLALQRCMKWHYIYYPACWLAELFRLRRLSPALAVAMIAPFFAPISISTD